MPLVQAFQIELERTLLYGLAPTDPVTILAASLLLLMVAAVAA